MKILVLGGTWFLGKAVVEGAQARGWDVATFNRGISGIDAPGVDNIRGDRTCDADLGRLAEGGPWDAVIDTSASALAPRDVLAGSRHLESVAGRYVAISTVNAYRDWPNLPLSEASDLLDAPSDADADFGKLPDGWDGPDWYYGRQKAGAERAVLESFGEDRSTILRPGVILGPGEYVGRLPKWLTRIARGGKILAPGDQDKSIQPVDVRDAATFALDQAETGKGGAFNVTAPLGVETMGGLLHACLETTGATGELVWAPDDLLIEQGVEQWTELPLWRTHEGVWRVDSSVAHRAGLRCRPLAQTVADTWRWLENGNVPVKHERWAEHGMDAEKEARILAMVGA
ncbi:NAD-dependent epimerase/dehydratase family protein [Streptomyces sp. 21So2-11]|uniref:NAD-dependent epimerase/dehydratase family protein n=1 Tax=Streptomyces sp. 21So2-11 TaxID=3144408 RepID=UPI0032198193